MPRSSLPRRDRALIAVLVPTFVGLGTAFTACIAGGPPIDPIADGEGGSSSSSSATTGTSDPFVDAPVTEAHAVVGATPSHGPFTGGQRVIVRGNGFTSAVRVWFGDTEATDVVPIDSTRVQVNAPPGTAGPVDLSAQNGDDASTRRSIAAGYVYDALYATPSSGPVAGGTDIRILGQGTGWNAATTAFIDGKPCTELETTSATELLCTVPQGTAGAKTVRVTGGGETITVLDAYTYEDSVDGFKGGLSGPMLSGKIRVLVYNNFTGDPIPGANVVLGPDLATAIVEQVGATGVVEIEDPELFDPVTVTVAALCHSPITFVDVPVDTVTVYLDPLITPACGLGGDPPGVGGKPGSSGTVRGEIVFPEGVEFERGPWTVPPPIGPNEVAAAYVIAAGSNPTSVFSLPGPTSAVTPTSPGTVGYEFGFSSGPGNRTFYAVAGLEDRTKNPPVFNAYAMGVVKGVPVFAGEETTEVYIQMESLDLALTIDPSPPPPGSNGPDRLLTVLAIRLGSEGYALLPSGQKAPLLPLSGDIDFVGVPELSDAFLGSTYYVSSRAVTGAAFTAPTSVVGSVQTTTTAFPVVVDGFVGLPTLLDPAFNGTWDGRHLELEFGPGSPIDLSVYDIVSGNGLVHWMVAVPGGGRAIEIPDLSQIQDGGLPSGPIVIATYGARIDDFDYGKLRYRNLRPAGMTAYSLDYVEAHLP